MAAEFWFNMRTRLVEEGPQSGSLDLAGPFATREEAERAPEVLARRSQAWEDDDEAERAWRSDES
ncbi:hypothetical protein [Microbacterium indicum]|uniref:hypothetical protein n=1 Tax=Microbacterium indicum TaxID=358100 RepID=UPI00055EEC58|nr:hypothetical protein [Microbacterium indicum]